MLSFVAKFVESVGDVRIAQASRAQYHQQNDHQRRTAGTRFLVFSGRLFLQNIIVALAPYHGLMPASNFYFVC